MKTIDVEGLPEPVAQAVAAMVEALREEFRVGGQQTTRRKVELPSSPGKVLGSLSREEIYKDIG